MTTNNLTTLYIATHNVTGLKYFGMTKRFFTCDELQKNYLGSGSYWKRHLKKYGKDVTMKIYEICEDSVVEDIAISFSLKNNIVESDDWANLCLETGTDANIGRVVSTKSRQKQSDSMNQTIIYNGEKMTIAKLGAERTALKKKETFVDYNGEMIPLSKKYAILSSETMRDTIIGDKTLLEIKAKKGVDTRKNELCVFEGKSMTIQERSNIKLSRKMKGTGEAVEKAQKAAETVAKRNPFYKLLHIEKGLIEEKIAQKDLRKISQSLHKTNKVEYLGYSNRSKAQLIQNGKEDLIGLYVERIDDD